MWSAAPRLVPIIGWASATATRRTIRICSARRRLGGGQRSARRAAPALSMSRHNSTLGTSGDNATMPSTFAVGLGENIIVAEVFYDYQPFLLTGIFEPSVFRHATFTRPRGTLFTTDPGC